MKMASSSTFQDFEAIYQSDTLPRPVEEYEFWVQKEFQRKPGLYLMERGEGTFPPCNLRGPNGGYRLDGFGETQMTMRLRQE